MSEIQKEQMKKIVYTFVRLANVNDKDICNDLSNHLSEMNEEDVIDNLVVALSDLAEKGQVKTGDIFSNIDLITSLSEKYMSKEDLMIDYQLDAKKQNNYNVIRKNANDSIVALIEGKINCLDVRKRT